MNVKNVRKLYEFMKALPPQAIRMDRYIYLDKPNETLTQAAKHTCGTTACIAGWAVLALAPRRFKFEGGVCLNPALIDKDSLKSISQLAKELLGLEGYEAESLFQGYWTDGNLADVTKRDVLRKLSSMLKEAEAE